MGEKTDFILASLDMHLESGKSALDALVASIEDYAAVYLARDDRTYLQRAAAVALERLSKDDKLPESSTACEHRHRLFIQSDRFSGEDEHERSSVHICADCGEFFVFAERNGEHIQITFTLSTPELVAAAGRYLKILEQDK